MKREQTEAEALFSKMAVMASEAGFILNEVNMTGRPNTKTPLVLSDYRVRSLPYAEWNSKQSQE